MESEREIENHDLLVSQSSTTKMNGVNGGHLIQNTDKENANPNNGNSSQTVRRHDEPSELSFEICKST